MKYYQRLKDLRTDKELNQSQIAEEIKTSQKQYSRWETGEYQIPFDKVIELAKYYNVSLDYIAGLTNNKGGIGCDKKDKLNIKQKHSGNGDNIVNLGNKE